MMYCKCNERNQWISNENNLSSSASLHRKSHENCVTQVPPKSALKSSSRSTTTTPKKSVKTIDIRNSPRYSTLPRTRSRGMNTVPNVATISRNEYSSTNNSTVTNNSDSPANSMSASPPPAPPPVPPLNPSCARCRHTSTATLQRQSQVIGSNPHLHASMSHQSSNYGIPTTNSYSDLETSKYPALIHKLRLTLRTSFCSCGNEQQINSVHQDGSEPQFDFVLNNNYTDLEQASEQFVSLGNLVNKQKVPAKVIKITKTVAVKQPVPVPYPVQVVKFIREQVPVHIPQPSSLPPLTHYSSSDKPQFQSDFSPSSYYNFSGNGPIISNNQQTYVGSKLSESYGPAQSYSFHTSESAQDTAPHDYSKPSSVVNNFRPFQSTSSGAYSRPAESNEYFQSVQTQTHLRPAQQIVKAYSKPSKEQEYFEAQAYPKQAQTSLSKAPSNEGFDTSPFYVKTPEHTIKFIPVPVYINSEEQSREIPKSSTPTSYSSDNEQQIYPSHHSQEPSGEFKSFTYSYQPTQNSQSHHSTEAPDAKHYYSPQDSQKSASSYNNNNDNNNDNNQQQQQLHDEEHQHYQIKYVYQ
ncbi:unnamed protein product [Diamesa serratosioi]